MILEQSERQQVINEVALFFGFKAVGLPVRLDDILDGRGTPIMQVGSRAPAFDESRGDDRLPRVNPLCCPHIVGFPIGEIFPRVAARALGLSKGFFSPCDGIAKRWIYGNRAGNRCQRFQIRIDGTRVVF